MSDRSYPLAQLRIKEPCTEAWDAMHEVGTGRHCDKCSKKVHDLSQMDLAEAQALLADPAAPVCVRMRQDAAGRIMTRDYWKVAAGVAVAALVGGAAAPARAQEKETMGKPGVPHVVERQDAPPPVVMGLVACPEPKAPKDVPAEGAPAKDIKMFPAAEEGFKRVVIRLPKLDREEQEAQVEIVATRIANVDAVNRHFIGGSLEAKVVQGWGYTYYELTAGKEAGGTLMAGPPEKMQPRPTPVAIRGKGFQGLRYNSRLPLVVYAPADVEVKYRVWTPGETKPAPLE